MNADESKYRLEILKMARELLNEEYINKRAEDHNKWLAECDVAWKTRGVKLPYPPFAPYPSEAEILAKAASLYNFVVEKPKESSPVIDIASAPSPWVTYLNPTPTPAPAEVTPSKSIVDDTTQTDPTPSPLVNTVAETTTQADDTIVKEDLTNGASADVQATSDLAKSKPLFATTPSVKSLLPNWLQPKENNV